MRRGDPQFQAPTYGAGALDELLRNRRRTQLARGGCKQLEPTVEVCSIDGLAIRCSSIASLGPTSVIAYTLHGAEP